MAKKRKEPKPPKAYDTEAFKEALKKVVNYKPPKKKPKG